MTTRRTLRRALRWLAGAALLTGMLAGPGPLGGVAQAIIGRPLTPMSYAGVARRTTRRAAVVGGAYGAYRYAPPPTVPYYYW